MVVGGGLGHSVQCMAADERKKKGLAGSEEEG